MSNSEKFKSELETKEKNLRVSIEKTTKLTEDLERISNDNQRLAIENDKLAKDNDKLNKDLLASTKKLEGIAKTMKLPPENIAKLMKKSDDDQKAIDSYVEMNKELIMKNYNKDCEIDQLNAQLKTIKETTEEPLLKEIEELKKKSAMEKEQEILNSKKEKDQEILDLKKEILDLKKEKEQELMDFKEKFNKDKNEELNDLKAKLTQEKTQEISKILQEKNQETINAKKDPEIMTSIDEKNQQERNKLQEKDQEIVLLKKSLNELKEGLEAQIQLHNEELEVEKALLNQEIQEKTKDIEDLLINVYKLEKDQKSSMKKIELLESKLKEEENTHRITEDEEYNQNKQKTALISIMEKESEEKTKQILKFEAENLRLTKENHHLTNENLRLTKENLAFRSKSPNTTLDITGTSNFEDEDRKIHEIEDKYKSEAQFLRSEIERLTISEKSLKEELSKFSHSNEEKIVNISNCNSPTKGSFLAEQRMSLLSKNFEETLETPEKSNNRIEIPSIIETKTLDNNEVIIGNMRKTSSFLHKRNKSSNFDYQGLYEDLLRNYEELQRNYEGLLEEFSVISTKNKEIEDSKNIDTMIKEENQEKIEAFTRLLLEKDEELKRNKKEFLKETQMKLRLLEKIEEFEKKIESFENEKREIKENNDQIIKELKAENEELNQRLDEINNSKEKYIKSLIKFNFY